MTKFSNIDIDKEMSEYIKKMDYYRSQTLTVEEQQERLVDILVNGYPEPHPLYEALSKLDLSKFNNSFKHLSTIDLFKLANIEVPRYKIGETLEESIQRKILAETPAERFMRIKKHKVKWYDSFRQGYANV